MSDTKTEYSEKYWHCTGRLNGASADDYFVANDLTLTELRTKIVDPWSADAPFNVGGTIIRSRGAVGEIQIVWTSESAQTYAERYNASLPRNVSDMATDRRLIALNQGDDFTHEMLFARSLPSAANTNEALVLSVCQRIGYTARILAHRSRQKPPFVILDEYDVQDLLHATLRSVIKLSVQEDPMTKVAGVRGSRADISVEDLGILIEVKFVRTAQDQKRIVQEFSQDLLLYSRWSPLRTLIFVVYNSGELRDPEALSTLGGVKEIDGRRFNVNIVLS